MHRAFGDSGSLRHIYTSARPGYPSTSVGMDAVIAEAKLWDAAGVSHVVLLLTPKEQGLYYGGPLAPIYESVGIAVWPFPIEDYGIPRYSEFDDLLSIVRRVLILDSVGLEVLIHCSAGVGRTGLFTQCLAAVHGPGALPNRNPQTHDQKLFVDRAFKRWKSDGTLSAHAARAVELGMDYTVVDGWKTPGEGNG